MGLFSKKPKGDEGFDVLTEIKEPFSFSNFFEEHVVERAKKIKRFLEEKGILFFLLSPFQQRNRLILQLTVIILGVLLGVVPRSMHLVEEAKERNAASELAGLIEKETQAMVGSITVRPLASSQYGKQHLLAFSITSSFGDSVPSTANRYRVELSAARGVLDAQNVSYAYEVFPISEGQRLLLVYVDNRNQNDDTGIYNLTVQVAEEEIAFDDRAPMEVVLSNTQKTNELFDESGVDLSYLTEAVLNNANTPIAKAWEGFEEAVRDYELETERIAGLPLSMTAVPSVEILHAFAKDHVLYPLLTDTSTTKDIADMPQPTVSASEVLSYPVGIEMNGKVYNAEYKEQLDSAANGASPGSVTAVDETVTEAPPVEGVVLTEEEEQAFSELSSLQAKADNLLRALTALNSAGEIKYNTLKSYKLMLNQAVDVSTFTGTGIVSDHMQP